MSELGGITELQMLEADIAVLKVKLDKAEKSDKASTVCPKIMAAVKDAEAKDGFLVREGGPPNAFHTSASSTADSGCCVLS
jgi:hypothetical protein